MSFSSTTLVTYCFLKSEVVFRQHHWITCQFYFVELYPTMKTLITSKGQVLYPFWTYLSVNLGCLGAQTIMQRILSAFVSYLSFTFCFISILVCTSDLGKIWFFFPGYASMCPGLFHSILLHKGRGAVAWAFSSESSIFWKSEESQWQTMNELTR